MPQRVSEFEEWSAWIEHEEHSAQRQSERERLGYVRHGMEGERAEKCKILEKGQFKKKWEIKIVFLSTKKNEIIDYWTSFYGYHRLITKGA